MQAGISTTTQSLRSATATSPVAVIVSKGFSNISLQSGILVSLSSGASLTYSVEVTGDDISAAGYDPSAGNWVPFAGMAGLTASAAATLGAVVSAIRLHVTAYTSGTATLQFVQLV